jgi:hypothetical protein
VTSIRNEEVTMQPTTSTRRGWAVAGALGGAVGIAGLLFTSGVTLPGQDHIGDNAAFAAAVADRSWYVWAAQVVCGLTAVCLAVFAAGLRRHLSTQEPAHSLVPALAVAGLGLTVVMLTVGGGISTELYWALQDVPKWDPDTIAAQMPIYNTMAWVWAGVGLTAAAVAVGGFRHGSVGKPFAVFSAVVAVLVAATQLFPVQYMALLPGALWVVVAGVRFTVRPQG